MSHAAVRARPGQDRTILYQEITDKIIAELEAGRLPWVQPWGTSAVQAPLAMPKNAATQHRYSEINVLILWGAVVRGESPWPRPFRRSRSARRATFHSTS
jgi:antirestriction protein ArdC